MTSASGHQRVRPFYVLQGSKVYSAWSIGQDDVVRLEIHSWIAGLYWNPAHAPSQPWAALTRIAPAHLRRAVIEIEGYPPVTIDYSERPVEGVVRLLRIS